MLVLAGEIRPVPRVEQRILEAEKLGFARILISKQSKLPKENYSIGIIKVNRIEDVVSHLFD
jgi:DNA repair protein RadA/Sms